MVPRVVSLNFKDLETKNAVLSRGRGTRHLRVLLKRCQGAMDGLLISSNSSEEIALGKMLNGLTLA